MSTSPRFMRISPRISVGSSNHWHHRLLRRFSWTSKCNAEDFLVLDLAWYDLEDYLLYVPLIQRYLERGSLFTLSNVQKGKALLLTWCGLDEEKQGCSQKRLSRKTYILIYTKPFRYQRIVPGKVKAVIRRIGNTTATMYSSHALDMFSCLESMIFMSNQENKQLPGMGCS